MRLDLVRIKQRLHKFLLRHGYMYENIRYWNARHDKWLHALEFVTPMMKATFNEYYYGIKGLEEKLRLMDKRIEEIAVSEPYVEEIKKLRCFKGVEYLTALSIICEGGDFKRFKNAETFMAFLSLVPGEYSSGNTRKQEGITKSGNTHPRKLLRSQHISSYN